MRVYNSFFVITGGYGSNLGDDAMLNSILLTITEDFSDKSCCVLCYNKKNIPLSLRSLNFKDIVFFDKNDNVKIIANYHIIGGGNQHFNFNKVNSLSDIIKRKIRHQFFNRREIFFGIIKRFKRQTLSSNHKIYYGIGLGPFENTPNLDYLKDSLVLFRESGSFEYFKHAELGCDPCFNPYYINNILQEISPEKSTFEFKKKVGIIVRDWYHDFKLNKEYLSYLQNYINLLRNDYEIYLINFCEVIDHDFKNYLTNYTEIVTYRSREDNMSSIFQIISKLDCLISQRYHGVVFGAILNIPSIAINLDPKMSRFVKEFSSKSVVNIETDLDPNVVMKLVKDQIDNSSNIDNKYIISHFETRYIAMVSSLKNYILKNEKS